MRRDSLVDSYYRESLADSYYMESLVDSYYRESLADSYYKESLVDSYCRESLAGSYYSRNSLAMAAHFELEDHLWVNWHMKLRHRKSHLKRKTSDRCVQGTQ